MIKKGCFGKIDMVTYLISQKKKKKKKKKKKIQFDKNNNLIRITIH